MCLLAGAAIPIPFLNESIGEVFFNLSISPALSYLGVYITFPLFYVLMWVIMIVIFALAMQGARVR
jgi:hypothetical protein